MKKILFCFLLFISSISFAQKVSADNVPDVVKNAFKKKFPTAQKVKWELDYDKYEVEFKIKKQEISAEFDKEGNWLETEIPIKPSAINTEVKEFVSKNFDGYAINEAEKIETLTKGVLYELEIKKGELIYLIVVSEKGQLISRTEVDKDGNKKAKSE